jgi:hypothetical protein
MIRKLGRMMSNIRHVGCLAIIAVIAIFLIASVVMYFVDRPPEVPQTAYMVTTDTRILYADEVVENEDGSITLSGWWETYRGRWVRHTDGDITIPDSWQPKVKANRGAKNQ